MKHFEIEAAIGVALAAMDTGAGPRPRLCVGDQTGANGIEFRVSKRDPQVGIIEGARIEAILPCMATGTVRRIPEAGVASVGIFQGTCEAVRGVGKTTSKCT